MWEALAFGRLARQIEAIVGLFGSGRSSAAGLRCSEIETHEGFQMGARAVACAALPQA